MKNLVILTMAMLPFCVLADGTDDYQVKVSYDVPEAPPAGTKMLTVQEKQFFKQKGYYFDNSSESAKKLYSLGHEMRPQAMSQSFLGANTLTKNIPIMAFNFNGFATIPKENVIGYEIAPVKNDKGYLVISEYFNDPDLGTCSITLDYVYKSGGGITYNSQEVEYYVNNKPGNQLASGSDETGYSYRLEWTDSKFHYNFGCANMKFDKNMLKQQVYVAQLIDNEASKF